MWIWLKRSQTSEQTQSQKQGLGLAELYALAASAELGTCMKVATSRIPGGLEYPEWWRGNWIEDQQQ